MLNRRRGIPATAGSNPALSAIFFFRISPYTFFNLNRWSGAADSYDNPVEWRFDEGDAIVAHYTTDVAAGPQLREISIKDDGPSSSFYVVEGFTYEVYQSDDLENWNLAWSTEGGGRNVEFLDDDGFGYSQRFYKVVKK